MVFGADAMGCLFSLSELSLRSVPLGRQALKENGEHFRARGGASVEEAAPSMPWAPGVAPRTAWWTTLSNNCFCGASRVTHRRICGHTATVCTTGTSHCCATGMSPTPLVNRICGSLGLEHGHAEVSNLIDEPHGEVDNLVE